MGSVFISESFPNRTVDDGLQQIHDENNDGFFTHHFDIALFDSLHPKTESELTLITGIKWESVRFVGETIDFTRHFSENKNKVVYVHETIHAKKDSSLFLRFGSDDGVKIWLNGKPMFSLLRQRGLRFNENTILLPLRTGSNSLLYKIEQGDGGWALQRNLATAGQVQGQFSKEVALLYSDVLESHWVGKSNQILLNIHQKTVWDKRHTLNWSWHSVNESPKPLNNHSQKPSPDSTGTFSIDTPTFWNRSSILWAKLSVMSGEVEVFAEWYPIFDSTYALATVHRIMNGDIIQPSGISQRDISVVYQRDLHPQEAEGWSYSTRYKSWILAQYLGLPMGISGPMIDAYISPTDKTRQVYRWFSQGTQKQSKAHLFVIHGEYEKDSDFWRSYEGVSHSLLAKRNALATLHGISVYMPHGRGIANFAGVAKEELSVIRERQQFNQRPVFLMSWSRGSFPLFEFAQDSSLQISTAILISPVVPDTEIEIWRLLSKIKWAYPSMRWIVFHGLNDAEVPVTKTRSFVALLKELFDDVIYEEVPFASHWNYPKDVEQESITWALQ